MTLASQITLNDGTTTINIDGQATHGLSENFDDLGGSVIHRMLDGTAVKQTHWTSNKKRITLTCSGWWPPELETLDWSQSMTLTIKSPTATGGEESYTVFCVEPPSETWTINEAKEDWTLVTEEV